MLIKTYEDLEDCRVKDVNVLAVVKNITDYGAFLEVTENVQGLLHISDISWRRVKNISDFLKVGQKIFVKVLFVNKKAQRASFGLKHTTKNPWITNDLSRWNQSIRRGQVSNIYDWGFLVDFESGLQAFVHVTELDWLNKNAKPQDFVNLGDFIDVFILQVFPLKEKMNASLKHLRPNPWKKFDNAYKVGDTIQGKICSITDFGTFCKLPLGVDGIIYRASYFDWFQPIRGNFIDVKIGNIDVEKERISLNLIDKFTKE